MSRRVAALAACALLAGGCAAPSPKGGEPRARGFGVEDLAKTDVDEVAEVNLDSSLGYLRLLMEKLYRRNPSQWRASGAATLEQAVARVFGQSGARVDLPELGGRRSIAAMRLAFDPAYRGDRVAALVAGLAGMLMEAYGGGLHVWVTTPLDPQKLYNSARNLEIAVWKLSHDRRPDGALYLVSNETGGVVDNLSFERLFGKLIALQDAMARVAAEAGNRRIRFVLESAASMAFIPL